MEKWKFLKASGQVFTIQTYSRQFEASKTVKHLTPNSVQTRWQRALKYATFGSYATCLGQYLRSNFLQFWNLGTAWDLNSKKLSSRLQNFPPFHTEQQFEYRSMVVSFRKNPPRSCHALVSFVQNSKQIFLPKFKKIKSSNKFYLWLTFWLTICGKPKLGTCPITPFKNARL
jgi:hypothetical protein